MADPYQTLRRSVHAFLKDYHHFTSFAALLGLPYAVSTLLSQSFSAFSSSFSPAISSLPFTFTFLLISKAVVIQVLDQKRPNFRSFFSSVASLYTSLLPTHVCNSILIITINCFQGLALFGPVAGLTCNLALILSGIERRGGYPAIIKACDLIRGRTFIALTLALPANLALAAIEALFEYRIISPYRIKEKSGGSMFGECLFIAYLYSIIIVLDTIITTMFVKSCIKFRKVNLFCLLNCEKEEDESYSDLNIIHCLL